MAWISVHEDVMGPKLRDLMKKSGLSGNEALGSLVKLWLWGIKNAEPGGLIISADRGDIVGVISANSGLSDGVNPAEVVDAIIESGWIDEIEDHMYLHDWDEWQEMYYRFIDKRLKDTARKRQLRGAAKTAGKVPLSPPTQIPSTEPSSIQSVQNPSATLSDSHIRYAPTREIVREYAKIRRSSVNPDQFFDYYDSSRWRDSDGKPILNWQQKFIAWEIHNSRIQSPGSGGGNIFKEMLQEEENNVPF